MPQHEWAKRPNRDEFDWLDGSMPKVFWIAGSDGKIRFLSKGFTDLTGLDAEDVIRGDGWKEVVYPEDMASLEALWRDARAGACESRSYFRMRMRGGHYRWMYSVGRPVLSSQSGDITHWVGGLIDVDDELRAHRSIERMNHDFALRVEDEAEVRTQLRWRFRSLFHDRTIGVIEIDMAHLKTQLDVLRHSGVDNLAELVSANSAAFDELMAQATTIAVNTALAHMLGFEDAEACLAGHRELLGCLGASNPLWLVVQAMFEGEDTLEGAADLMMVGGGILRVAYAVKMSDDFTCYATFVDITEQQRMAELQLSAQSELAQASRTATIGALSISIAHELDQPLTSMRIELQALERAIAGLDEPSGVVQASLQRLRRQCERLTGVLHRTRDRVLTHERSVDLIDLAALAQEIPFLLQREVREGGVQLDVARPHEPCFLHADPVELQQVLVNLVLNAIEAVRQMPTDQRKVTIRIETVNRGVCVRISDSGPGIPEHDLPHIFEPFFTTKPGGVGMGLQICRTLVEGMGGDLQAYNALSGGSMFTFWLPY